MMTVVFLIAAVADTMALPGDGPAFSIHGSGRRRFHLQRRRPGRLKEGDSDVER